MAPLLVVVGTSLGGLDALKALLGRLPAGFPLAVVVAQHRLRTARDTLVAALAASSPLPVVEPEDKEELKGGRVYVAPADYHLLVEPGSLVLSTEAPVNYSRPSIDVLFESAADAYGGGVVGVILTGASRDGAKGCARIKERGGCVLVQAPADAEASVMPAAVVAACDVDKVLPLADIPAFLIRLCQPGERPAWE